MSRLPDEVSLLYDGLESQNGIKLDATARRMYYEEFCQKASGSDTLQSYEVEHLIKSKLGFKLKPDDLQAKTADFAELCNDGLLKSDGLYTFEVFVRLVLYILQTIKVELDEKSRSASTEERRLLPIDPESRMKQWWDVLCSLLLLFCAFSVPFSIAFEEPTATLSPRDISDLVIDAIFMVDIALAFVTAYDDQGCFVKDLRKIRVRYLQTWFFLDVAGSFPFDIVITVALESSGPGSVGGLGSLKFIRMLRLIRAWKFMNRLKKLKDKDGYEAIGSAVTLGSALFLLIFSAHVLGCFITIIMQSEPDNNWLLHYNAELANGENWVRYLTAMYWATITLTTMGYGDIVPVTNVERIYVIMVALVGAVIFSHCLGTISSLISQVAGVEDRVQAKARSVQEYLQFRGLPTEVRRKVKAHYQHCWR
jgi:hypothetical protein